MSDRKTFNLFYGAREQKEETYKAAYESGADINFQFEGRKGARGAAGRWYYGDLVWYAPDGVNGEKGDTLLIIAIKTNNSKLVSWMLSLEKLDISKRNSIGQSAFDVAKDLNRSSLLTGISDTPVGAADTTIPPPPAATSDNKADEELARLTNTIRSLKISNDDRDSVIKAQQEEIEKFKQIVKEKDSTISDLQNKLLGNEREVVVMMHKTALLQEQLAQYTDFRQADAEIHESWGTADYHGSKLKS